MLMMFAEDITKVPLEKACPLNTEDLLLVLAKDVAIGLCNIQNESENYFSIKGLMEKEKVFSCTDFEARCKDFSEIMDTRLERFYDTRKAKYIFFDEEEQKVIADIFLKNKLNCVVKIFLRTDEDNSFQPVDFEEITPIQYDKVKKYIRKYKIKYVIRPDRYMELKIKRSERAEDFKAKYEKKKHERELGEIKMYFSKYPDLEKINSQEEFKKIYREMMKRYHPDKNNGDDTVFKEVAEDLKLIQKTAWYKKLGTENNPRHKEEKKDKPKKNKIDKDKRDGIVHKMLKYIVFSD